MSISQQSNNTCEVCDSSDVEDGHRFCTECSEDAPHPEMYMRGIPQPISIEQLAEARRALDRAAARSQHAWILDDGY